jgi:hypothetical protein
MIEIRDTGEIGQWVDPGIDRDHLPSQCMKEQVIVVTNEQKSWKEVRQAITGVVMVILM